MIDFDTILKVIHSFYDIARSDILIGYHFRVIEDFDEHIPRIADFWNLQLNGELQNKANLPFNLLGVHRPLKINKGEVFRWEKLFKENIEASLTTEQVELWMLKVQIFKKKILEII